MGNTGSTPQVTFDTGFFGIRPDEDEATYPGRYGEALARWMQQRLEARGVITEGVIAEDFGWLVIVTRKPFLLWLGCGHIDGSTTEWSLFPAVESSLAGRLFGRRRHREALDALWRHVEAIVPGIPDVANIRWE
ncbi:hypothetical protein ATSB10_00390 [Dyella thiooxydans]|uniref:Uncharacterized protein n=1 Tax=Dyella thiooxydans TaxID=445710 RepID=A0A160MWD9_9GAMM|nr:hypothetical protein ATSB10_00390 [Dyella thiooxydans]